VNLQGLDFGWVGGVAADSNFTLNVATVPEPESYAMLLSGLGLIGFITRRRKGQRSISVEFDKSQMLIRDV